MWLEGRGVFSSETDKITIYIYTIPSNRAEYDKTEGSGIDLSREFADKQQERVLYNEGRGQIWQPQEQARSRDWQGLELWFSKYGP